MISWIGLASGRPNGQELEEEETDISQGGNAHVRHSPPFRQRGGNIGAAARHRSLVSSGPRRNTGSSGSSSRRHHGAKAAEINRRTAGSSQLTLASVFSPDSGICLFAGTARLPPPPRRILAKCATSSRQTAAWKRPRKKKRSKTRVCLAAQKSGGGVFTSPPFLLPRAVGNQLLRTGKTPFVPPPTSAAALRGRAQRPQASQCRRRPLLAYRYGCTLFKKCLSQSRKPSLCLPLVVYMIFCLSGAWTFWLVFTALFWRNFDFLSIEKKR